MSTSTDENPDTANSPEPLSTGAIIGILLLFLVIFVASVAGGIIRRRNLMLYGGRPYGRFGPRRPYGPRRPPGFYINF